MRGVRIVTYDFATPKHNLAQHAQVPWEHQTMERQLRFKETGQRGDTLFNVLVDHKRIETMVLVQAGPSTGMFLQGQAPAAAESQVQHKAGRASARCLSMAAASTSSCCP